MTDDSILRAQDSYDRDRRFRAMADSVAHETYSKHYPGCMNDEGARDAIRFAATLMLQRIYDEDAELRYLREMVERLMSDRLSLTLLQPDVQAVLPSPLQGPQHVPAIIEAVRAAFEEEPDVSPLPGALPHAPARDDDPAAE